MRAVTVGLLCRPPAAAEPDLSLLFKRKLQRFAAVGAVRTVAVGEFVGVAAAAVGIVDVGLKICFQRRVNKMFLDRHEELLMAIFRAPLKTLANLRVKKERCSCAELFLPHSRSYENRKLCASALSLSLPQGDREKPTLLVDPFRLSYG